MISDLKPYPTYKDSGVSWLGKVPEHWEVERLKKRARNIVELTRERPAGAAYVALEHVEGWTGRILDGSSDATFESQVKRFHAGDVLFGKLRPYLAKVTRPNLDGVCVGEFFVLRPRKLNLDASYLEYLLRSKPIIDAINSSTFGAKMPRADWQFVGNIGLAFPPIPEQSAIVRFIDHADRRIRRYIRTKQKLVKLLEEQKQVIIHRAVTRGLDPNVRLKPSGVEWLGNVPEHWDILPLKFLSRRIQNGATPPTSEPGFYDDGTIPWYGPTSCSDGELVTSPVRHLSENAFALGRARLIHGPALLVIVIGATAGRMALLPEQGSTNQQITAFELRSERVDALFVLRQLRSAESWLRATASTATIPILDAGEVARLPVAFPSLSDQREIVRRTDETTQQQRKAIDRAQHEIDLLHEYRTRLIADVVTGKLDVRNAAAKLPIDVEEAEPLDEIETLPGIRDREDNLDSLDQPEDSAEEVPA